MKKISQLAKKLTFYNQLISWGTRKINSISTRSVFYILLNIEQPYYILKCINTKAIIQVTLPEIIYKLNIISRMHPIQACFIGIEYAKFTKINLNTHQNATNITKFHRDNDLNIRYQLYAICRNKQSCYFDIQTNEYKLINTIKLAHTTNLIKDFSAEQAFYIGLSAGNILFKR